MVKSISIVNIKLISVTSLLLLLIGDSVKPWNFLVDCNLQVCLWIQMIPRFCLDWPKRTESRFTQLCCCKWNEDTEGFSTKSWEQVVMPMGASHNQMTRDVSRRDTGLSLAGGGCSLPSPGNKAEHESSVLGYCITVSVGVYVVLVIYGVVSLM